MTRNFKSEHDTTDAGERQYLCLRWGLQLLFHRRLLHGRTAREFLTLQIVANFVMVLFISIKLLAIRVANSRTVCSIDASGAVGSLQMSKVNFVSASSVVPNENTCRPSNQARIFRLTGVRALTMLSRASTVDCSFSYLSSWALNSPLLAGKYPSRFSTTCDANFGGPFSAAQTLRL